MMMTIFNDVALLRFDGLMALASIALALRGMEALETAQSKLYRIRDGGYFHSIQNMKQADQP